LVLAPFQIVLQSTNGDLVLPSDLGQLSLVSHALSLARLLQLSLVFGRQSGRQVLERQRRPRLFLVADLPHRVVFLTP
jgi:hypothetical protein